MFDRILILALVSDQSMAWRSGMYWALEGKKASAVKKVPLKRPTWYVNARRKMYNIGLYANIYEWRHNLA